MCIQMCVCAHRASRPCWVWSKSFNTRSEMRKSFSCFFRKLFIKIPHQFPLLPIVHITKFRSSQNFCIHLESLSPNTPPCNQPCLSRPPTGETRHRPMSPGCCARPGQLCGLWKSCSTQVSSDGSSSKFSVIGQQAEGSSGNKGRHTGEWHFLGWLTSDYMLFRAETKRTNFSQLQLVAVDFLSAQESTDT